MLKKGWRNSTLKTYLPAIRAWIAWCKVNNFICDFPTGSIVAKYLAHLFLKENYSPSTILVHKSAISTFCGPNIVENLSSHFLVKQILKAVSLARPATRRLQIWDPRIVVDWLSTAESKETLFEASRRTAIILLLASGRRVHDLTLLKVSNDCLIEGEGEIILHPTFGSKTDSSTHRQSSWQLIEHSDKGICPVFWIRRLVKLSQNRRAQVNNLDNLFISVNGPVRPASRTIIGGWIRSVLREAGIDATPGSIRAAVASLGWLQNQPVDEILSRGNWKAEKTFKRHYCKKVDSNNSVKENNHFKNFKPI